MKVLFLILWPMAMAFVCWGIGRADKPLRNVLAIAVGWVELLAAVWLFLRPDSGGELPGLCVLGLRFAVDGFRRVYTLVVAFMWFLTLLFSPAYFAHHHNRNRYYFFNLLTLGATLGVFLARDLFTAFVFFEIMSFTSFTWVIQEQTAGAIRAANTYLAVAVIGGLVALMGLFLLQYRLATTELSTLHEAAAACPHKGTLYTAGACILFGFGAKAGMFPLHIWLPKAHPVAPAPASSLLSGVLTKSGIWGILAVSCNLFRDDAAWGTVILILGCVTMFLGALLALFSIDLKRTLACSSMSQIGFILVGIGMMGLLGRENALAARGTLLHMVNHSLFKLVLFLCAAAVYMNLHALDLNEIRGFGRKKPLLTAAFLLGALGIGGVPLLNGYISKTLLHESIVEGAVHYGSWLKAAEWVFLVSGGLTVAYMTKLFVAIFVQKHPTRQQEFDEKRRYLTPASAAALAIAALTLPVLGLGANRLMNGLADLGTDFFHPGHLEHAVAYYSPENLKGGAISIAIGAAVYLLVVRSLLYKDGVYLNRWPKWLDLEELLYRPLLLRILPGSFGFLAALFGENRISAPAAKAILSAAGKTAALFGENKLTGPAARKGFRLAGWLSRGFGDLTDAVVLLLGKTVLRQCPPPSDDQVRHSLPYRAGALLDRRAAAKGRAKDDGTHYAMLFYRAYRTVKDTTRAITGNLSFALLMLCLAMVFVFAYLLFFGK